MASGLSTSLHLEADVTYDPSGGTYFHAMLDEETRVLILINLQKI